MSRERPTTIAPGVSESSVDYARADLLRAFREAGLASGDLVFTVVDLVALGKPADCPGANELFAWVMAALQEAVGPAGTILVPTYTFSFCRRELFDVERTPAAKGPWSPSTDFLEYARQLPGAVRSADPIHSVVGLGPKAAKILFDAAPTCFGEDSFFHRLRKLKGKICAIGVPLQESNFQHHVEETVGVPFRFKKLFTGDVRSQGVTAKKGWIYNVGILSKNGQVDGHRLEKEARQAGLCRATRLGRGEVLGIDSVALFELTSQSLAADPWFTARGPAADPIELEKARVAGPRFEPKLPDNASMEEMIRALWRLPRDIVSEGYDAALRALATRSPMQVHEYPTGTECWSWTIPEKWTCHEAWLETLDGRRLFSYADHPLHVVSYSLPFEGEVSRRELFEHLHVHWKIPDAIPFIFKYYERDWGLCCSKKLKDTLTDERYRVKIGTDFSYGTLKVGETVVPGQTDECIILCAHLCHPAMVNDDLSGVVVGMKVMQELRRRTGLRYTYRFLILPETIGSVAYLSHNEHLIPKMKGGLFLEMLGLDYPHALQLSLSGKMEMDLCVTAALRSEDPHAWIGNYRTVVGNDERQFNGPGVRVPMLSLSRVLPGKVCDFYYPEYHSSYDTPELASNQRLEQSLALVLKMVDTLEQNIVPVNRFKGEVFCSRYGLFIDPYINPEGNDRLFSIMDLIDGSRSIAEIAAACNTSFETVKAIVSELTRRQLVDCR